MTTDRVREQESADTAGDMVDDLAEHLDFALDDMDERLTRLVDDYALDRPRAADILRQRLGLGDHTPQTLTRIAAGFDFSRDRIRQLHTKAVGELLRQATLTGALPAAEFATRYPTTAKDQQLVRALLTETYVTATDLVANELSYLKLRLAGHDAADAKRISGFVAQRLAAWRKKTNHRLARLHDGAPFPVGHDPGWLDRIEWPTGSPTPLPTDSARTLDGDDDGRGRFYLDKVGRDVGFDSGLEARLLGILNADENIRTFQENPDAVLYRVDGEQGVHFPTVAAQLADGRVALIDVQPLGRIAFRDYRARAAAARAYAHDNGWGWLVWTGSMVGVAELVARRLDAAVLTPVAELVEQGAATWPALRRLRIDAGLEPLDLGAAVLRHDWSWDRGSYRISASPASPS